MNKRRRKLLNRRSKFSGIRMEPDLYAEARRKASLQRQSFSEYTRQLIVRDLAAAAAR